MSVATLAGACMDATMNHQSSHDRFLVVFWSQQVLLQFIGNALIGSEWRGGALEKNWEGKEEERKRRDVKKRKGSGGVGRDVIMEQN